eukprot:scaffold147325_cov36-Tisochrysis_lutea.AAC.2
MASYALLAPFKHTTRILFASSRRCHRQSRMGRSKVAWLTAPVIGADARAHDRSMGKGHTKNRPCSLY